jgi:hypothetical protein
MILSDIDKKGERSGEKEVIKVFVITGPKTNGVVTYENEVSGQKVYSGIAWDTLEAAKKHPDLKKYKFEYTFSEPTFTNYSETVDWVSNGKYDLGLATYSQTKERESKINYTVPVFLDAFAVYHYSNKNEFDTLSYILSKLGYQFLVLIILGIITGVVLFFVDPQRSIVTKVKSRKAFMIRSITTGIATFFGEAGFLFENSSSIKGLIAITLIMLISLVFLQFMQAEITTMFIDNQMSDEISPLDINTILAIGHEGYAHTTRWEENGGTVELFKEKNNVELLEVYNENQSKYLGVILSYYDGFPLLELNPGLKVSIFGNTMGSMIYNPRKVKFGEDLNKGLLYIRSTKELREICKGNFKSNIPNPPVSCTM